MRAATTTTGFDLPSRRATSATTCCWCTSVPFTLSLEASTAGRGRGRSWWRGIRVGEERVRKLMSRHGSKAHGKRKFKATTDSNYKLLMAENLLNREFSPSAPDSVWASDITYVASDEGWPYLAVSIDLCSAAWWWAGRSGRT
jgi:transposase InsO family protein